MYKLYANKVFIVFDVHGCYDLLLKRLDEVGYDQSVDTLVLGGDLVDRGPDSYKVLKLLHHNNVYGCIGNHEHMIYEHLVNGYSLNPLSNGSEWVGGLSNHERNEVIKLIGSMHQSIIINDTIGIVHAEVPNNDWNDLVGVNCFDGDLDHIWSRNKISMNDATTVKNIDKVFVGHTPVREVFKLGNVNYCDLGAYWTDKMHIEVYERII